MTSTPQHRKVLVFGDPPSIRDLLKVLMQELERADAAIANKEQALATIRSGDFDTVLLDLRCLNRQTRNGVHGIGGIWPSVVGRVLVITTEVSDPETLELVERRLLHRDSHNGLLHELASRFRIFFRLTPSPNRSLTPNP
ncbi:MAG: hypothetical protein M1423_06835 [Acidobacteria bacterium]|nr:hypothetical protein [Acidobacteriota bacterium]